MSEQQIYNAETDISVEQQAINDCYVNRAKSYQELGNWQEQLDMIYHDFDGWKQKISDIKTKYPKP